MKDKRALRAQSATTESPCTAAAIRKASRRLTQFYDDALAPCGLRSTQYTLLAELARYVQNAPTMTELAAALVMDRSALGHNLKPLERDGLIVFVTSEGDARRRCIKLTPQGKAKVRQARKYWQMAQARFEKVFGKKAAFTLRTTMLGIAYDARLSLPL
ncbi:MAG: MarR family winged helix-turn-helix transcriptional regulator [Pseudomonadota bacterium]